MRTKILVIQYLDAEVRPILCQGAFRPGLSLSLSFCSFESQAANRLHALYACMHGIVWCVCGACRVQYHLTFGRCGITLQRSMVPVARLDGLVSKQNLAIYHAHRMILE